MPLEVAHQSLEPWFKELGGKAEAYARASFPYVERERAEGTTRPGGARRPLLCSSVQIGGVRRNTTDPTGLRPPGGDEDTKSQPSIFRLVVFTCGKKPPWTRHYVAQHHQCSDVLY